MKQVLKSQTSYSSLVVPGGTGCAQVQTPAQGESFHLGAAWAPMSLTTGAELLTWRVSRTYESLTSSLLWRSNGIGGK